MNALASMDLKMPLSPWRMRFFATSLGLLVANLYYLHPMLTQVAASFGIGTTQAGYLVTCTQMQCSQLKSRGTHDAHAA